MDLPPRALAWVLGVEVAAVAALIATVEGAPPPRPSGSPRCSPSSRWRTPSSPPASSGPAAGSRSPRTSTSARCGRSRERCSCPPPLAAAVVVVVYAHLWQRVWRPVGRAAAPPRLHDCDRRAGRDGGPRGRDGGGRAAVGPGGRGRSAGRRRRGAGLRRGEHRAHRRRHRAVPARRPTPRELMGRWDDNALEIATLCLGGLAAVALGGAPFLVALALPPILVLHRAVRVRHLEEAASLDGKTGLLNAATWRTRADARGPGARRAAAARACSSSTSTTSRRSTTSTATSRATTCSPRSPARCARPCAARTSSAASAGRSSWCSSAALPAGRAGRGRARRRRRAAAEARSPGSPCRASDGAVIDGLTASVGAACVGDPRGRRPRRALRAADACLYAAKRGGRNRVRIAGTSREMSGASRCPRHAPRATPRREPTSGAETVP